MSQVCASLSHIPLKEGAITLTAERASGSEDLVREAQVSISCFSAEGTSNRLSFLPQEFPELPPGFPLKL